jgi:phage terminase large subunit
MPKIDLRPYQEGFIFSKARFPALISAVGTGKTLCGISRMMDLMETYPDNLGIVVRKEFTDLKDSTIKDFELYTGLKVGSNKDCTLPNGSLIMFRHGDEINVLKNINAGAILIEQAEEFDNDETFTFLRDRLRRKQAKLRSLFIIANANGHNWIYNTWVVPNPDKEFECYQATTFDNADNLPPDYIADLKKMENTHPSHYRRYVLNSHDDIDTVDRIIEMDAVNDAVNNDIFDFKHDKRMSVVCDPARYGDDETVIYVLKGNKIIAQTIYKQKDTMYTAGQLVVLKTKYGAGVIIVDVIGIGAGIVDRLLELGQNVFSVNSAATPLTEKEQFKFKNIRSEMWYTAADKFFNNQVCIVDDQILKEQLAAVRYKTIESNGRLQVESKEELKKRIGRSPDRADCLVMGLWGMEHANYEFETNAGLNAYHRRIQNSGGY